MENRQIVYNVVLVHETIHSNKENKEKRTIINIDMANAFDRVRNSFLFEVMTKFGFFSSFIHLVSFCISAPWIAPLVKCRPTSFFQGIHGLR
jgi:hypothetical protein